MINYKTEAAVIAMYPTVGQAILTDKIVELCEKVRMDAKREKFLEDEENAE